MIKSRFSRRSSIKILEAIPMSTSSSLLNSLSMILASVAIYIALSSPVNEPSLRSLSLTLSSHAINERLIIPCRFNLLNWLNLDWLLLLAEVVVLFIADFLLSFLLIYFYGLLPLCLRLLLPFNPSSSSCSSSSESSSDCSRIKI